MKIKPKNIKLNSLFGGIFKAKVPGNARKCWSYENFVVICACLLQYLVISFEEKNNV